MYVAILTKAACLLLPRAEVLLGVVAVPHPEAAIAVAAAVAPEAQAGRLPAIPSKVLLTVAAAALPTRFRVLQVAGVNSVYL